MVDSILGIIDVFIALTLQATQDQMAPKAFRGFRVQMERKVSVALLGRPPFPQITGFQGNLVVLVCKIQYIWFCVELQSFSKTKRAHPRINPSWESLVHFCPQPTIATTQAKRDKQQVKQIAG